MFYATDGSDTAENAGSFAVDLAAQLKCDLYCLYVADAAEYPAGMELADMYLPIHQVILEKLTEEGQEAIKKVEAMAAEKGVNFTGEVLKGKSPVKEIIDAAEKQGADLIVVGSHGKKTSLLDIALGEVPPQLLAARLPCPITVVRPG